MSIVDNTLFEGSVKIVDNDEPATHGYGDLTVTRNLTVDSSSGSNNTVSLTADLTSDFTVTGGGANKLVLASNGTGVDAIDVNATAGGVTVDSVKAVSIDVSGASEASNFTTSGSNSTLTLSAAGGGTNQVTVASAGTGVDAIRLNATAGGVDVDATKKIAIDTTDTTDGVQIATGTSAVPVTIGTAASLTTIKGSLLVEGTTTTINTETLTAEDPIFAVNFIDNGSGGVDYGMLIAGTDSGMYHIREETDIKADTKALSATGTSASSGSTTTLTMPAYGSLTSPKMSSGEYATVDFFKTWLICMTSGPANGNTRRITANTVGPTPTITVTPAFSVQPTPGGGDTFELYAPAISAFYDESLDEYAFAIEGKQHTDNIMSPMDYIDIHAGGATFEDDVLIKGDLTVLGTFTVPCFETEDIILPADATTAVDITKTDTRGAFMLLVEGLDDTVAGGNPASTHGAAATFVASKRTTTLTNGSISRTSNSDGSVVGSNSEKLRVRWPAAGSGKLQLYHQTNPGGGGGETITYRIRIICI